VTPRETADALATLGIGHAVLASGEDGAVLVSPDCGRLLGIWPHGRAENALWTDAVFFEVLRGAARREDWMNPGGDRVWLGPDEEFLDPAGTAPASVDPGHYARLGEKAGCRMENRGDAWAARSEIRVAFRIERRFLPRGPRELAAAWGVPHLRQAGCLEETTLEVTDDAPRVRLQGIAQVRAGGATWIPLARRRADAPAAGGPIGSFAVEDGCAVVHPDGPRRTLVFTEADARPRLLHLSEIGAGRSLLLVKECARDEGGDSAIRCVSGMASTELCLESPAVGGTTGRQRIVWRQGLYAFLGRTAEVRILLGRIAQDGASGP
jgi:hypothetical protein